VCRLTCQSADRLIVIVLKALNRLVSRQKLRRSSDPHDQDLNRKFALENGPASRPRDQVLETEIKAETRPSRSQDLRLETTSRPLSVLWQTIIAYLPLSPSLYRMKEKKTRVKKKTLNPTFNESFMFDLPPACCNPLPGTPPTWVVPGAWTVLGWVAVTRCLGLQELHQLGGPWSLDCTGLDCW